MTTPTLTVPSTVHLTSAFMTRSPLSPNGVQGKITELYSLSDEQLQTEADAVQADFKFWIKQNFFLSAGQKAYLSRLDEQTLSYFGSQCSICFTNRLPIALDYPIPPETDYSKWTGSSNSLTVRADEGGKFIASGKLVFKFTYTV
jgi:hypothetical protein